MTGALVLILSIPVLVFIFLYCSKEISQEEETQYTWKDNQ